MEFDDFATFFKFATGNQPFPYQQRLAETKNLPCTLAAPTGAGKTAAAVLGWLWRRRFATEEIRRSTPRRLVYCLPMRVLVEQTRDEAILWLNRLGMLAGTAHIETEGGPERVKAYQPLWDNPRNISISVLMGGEHDEEWELYPERDAIVIGTQDMLVSRALNRGYGMSRHRWPVHFGLLNSDCLWVFDEIQLMGSSLATTAQLAAFRKKFGTFGQCHCLWMSATLRRDWLRTVDFQADVDSLAEQHLQQNDKDAIALARRLTASKQISKINTEGKGSKIATKKIAREIFAKHQAGSLTLVVVNTVERATTLYDEIRAQIKKQTKRRRKKTKATDMGPPELLLIHSHFRPSDREEKMRHLGLPLPSGGTILVSTQVIEAGVNLSARVLFTELAPWPSLVQRFGRCNRYGEHQEAQVYWIDLPTRSNRKTSKSLAAPYDDAELNAARRALEQIERTAGDVSPASLEMYLASLREQDQAELFPYHPDHVIRRKDMIELFDTTPDLAGNDIDVSRFIRDDQDLDVYVFWRDVPENGSPLEQSAPRREELCSVPLGSFRDFLKGGGSAWRWDFLEGRWVKPNTERIIPGQTYLIRASEGGYSVEKGWDRASKEAVDPVRIERRTVEPEANDSDVYSTGDWQSIAEHTEQVVAELKRILETLDESIALGVFREALREAARWHDRGKAHAVFQASLGISEADILRANQLWAKSPNLTRRHSRKGFRHELASALAMLQANKPDLACYLAAAHHGRIRLSIRSLPGEQRPAEPNKRFARGIWDGDELPSTDLGGGRIAPAVKLSLEPMELGLSEDGKPSWAERMLALRSDDTDGHPGSEEVRLGPFRLAFLEAILRAADIRASVAHAVRSRRQEVGHV